MNEECVLQEISFFEVQGFSMWPFLVGGEKVIVKKVTAPGLKRGDIVLYRGSRQLICHRLVKKIRQEGRWLLFARSDTLRTPLEPVTEEMLLGKVCGIVKKGKFIGMDGWRYRLANPALIVLAPLFNAAVKTLVLCRSRFWKR